MSQEEITNRQTLTDGSKIAVIGEMAIFEQRVRAAGKARVITIDKKIFFARVSEDPTLAFRILEKMSNRIRQLDKELMDMKKKTQP